jgi:NAD(P)-dependent dehydrogenase (short-subunit alcohol dehydrogenase family)
VVARALRERIHDRGERVSRLEGCVALVTGAAQGVGRGIALALASEGASIAVVDRNLDGAADAARECTGRGVRAEAFRCDVANRGDVMRVVDSVIDTFGTLRILVNNAHAFTLGIPLLDTSDEDMEQSWRTAVLGTLYFMQAAHGALSAEGGTILNIGSGSALDGDVGSASYASAKEGVRVLTRVAAREWGPDGIRVNTLCPFSRSPRWEAFAAEHPGRVERQAASLPLRRAPGDPELDIGRAALFLVSDDSSYVTGQTLFVEGGRMRT